MRIDLDARLITRDGESAGSIERAVFDPATNEVTHFVVDTGGLLGKQLLVPRHEFVQAGRDGDAVRLRLTKQQLDRIPAYIETAYTAPPIGWMPPAGFGWAPGVFVWPGGAGPYLGPAPMMPDRDRYATRLRATHATGEGETAGASAPEPTPTIGKGTPVVDRDGNDVGVVDDVRFDDATGELRALVLRTGAALRTLFGGGQTTEIDARYVAGIEEELVRLNVNKDRFDRLTHPPRAA